MHDHTPEPWRIGGFAPRGPSPNVWAGDPDAGTTVIVARCADPDRGVADARRIVACVNALAGITDDRLADRGLLAVLRRIALVWATDPGGDPVPPAPVD